MIAGFENYHEFIRHDSEASDAVKKNRGNALAFFLGNRC